MDFVHADQILTLALFLGLLFALWGFARFRGKGLARTMRAGKRIILQEVTALSPSDRGMIVAVDGKEFFVIHSKGNAPVLVALDHKEAAE
ncbi:flagellar assembly protein FliO [Marivivens sp. LCG002]|uniref:flagellar assembly protein FliO n=1 Tax=Marivivens sp. LCG002 TaxID=3051171 RepID=UPI0025576F37|nr:flagellar assembly protein FliO [Marivivens sp. LCG002]WIV51284.1 flagellar assembly protein FliO [Marivivens sp. LCG002]